MAHVLVLAAHPDLRMSRVNRTLIDTALALARVPPAGQQIEVVDLYAAYPDYVINVDAEQARARRADLIVWLHPIHWYAMPPLMKLWLDDVLTPGWAYAGGQALAGKDLWLVASTGGPADAYHPRGYNRYFFDAFLPPYEQTAALCGVRFLPPLVLHGAHGLPATALAAHAATFREHLASYPAWPELEALGECPTCAVPADDRPPTEGLGAATPALATGPSGVAA